MLDVIGLEMIERLAKKSNLERNSKIFLTTDFINKGKSSDFLNKKVKRFGG